MLIKKTSKNLNIKTKTFRVFASRQKGKVARVQFNPGRKKSKRS